MSSDLSLLLSSLHNEIVSFQVRDVAFSPLVKSLHTFQDKLSLNYPCSAGHPQDLGRSGGHFVLSALLGAAAEPQGRSLNQDQRRGYLLNLWHSKFQLYL